MAEKSVLGDNDIDDVRWLCSLTEPEIDLLMELKNLVRLRAEELGHKALAEKFDLKMLRSFGYLFMEDLRERVKDLPGASRFTCNILNQEPGGSFGSMTIEELCPYVCSDRRKTMEDLFFGDMPPAQKQKTSH